MKPYAQALKEFKVAYFLRAIEEAQGSYNKAAELACVHRNAVSRNLNEAGYSCKKARAATRPPTVRKPPRPEIVIAYRESALTNGLPKGF